jgi:hypothetical protein
MQKTACQKSALNAEFKIEYRLFNQNTSFISHLTGFVKYHFENNLKIKAKKFGNKCKHLHICIIKYK